MSLPHLRGIFYYMKHILVSKKLKFLCFASHSRMMQFPPVPLLPSVCRRAPSAGCAGSSCGRRSPCSLRAALPERADLCPEPGAPEQQPADLCSRTGPSCRSCSQAGGARTRSRPRQTAVRACCGTTELGVQNEEVRFRGAASQIREEASYRG